MNNNSHYSRKPITFEFFKNLTIYYFSLAALVTTAQIVFEYYKTKDSIELSIKEVVHNFSDSLSNSLWEFNEVQTNTILAGIYQSPYVTEITLLDADDKVLFSKKVEHENNRKLGIFNKILPIDSNSYNLTLFKDSSESSSIKVGTISVFTSNTIIFDQISGIIYYVLFNSIIKTIGLWLIILLLLKRKVRDPILTLVDDIKNINPKNPTTIEVSKDDNVSEISDIIINFNNLSTELKKYKDILEAIIENKTELLEERNEEVQSLLLKLKDAQDRIIDQEKMSSLGLVSAGIAHELRNPLNLSKNSIVILQDVLEKNYYTDNVQQLLKIVLDNNTRMETIITNMLLQGKKSDECPSLINLNSFVTINAKAIQKSLRTKSSEQCQIEILIPKSIHINIFPHDFGRLLLNVFENAFYAINEKFNINEFKPKLTVSILSETSDIIKISIRDNGTGISPDIKKKILEPFYTTKPPGEGTGLGLYLSYDVAKQHGGHMEINSIKGEFTEVIISLSKLLNKKFEESSQVNH